jgi:hypothetical protein
METKNDEEKLSNFFCEKCHYTTRRKCDYVKHMATRKHLENCLETNGDKKEFCDLLLYECVKCNYTTNFKVNYERHLTTEKHKKNLCGKEKETNHICCLCNKEYKNYRTLWKHKKHCDVGVVTNENTSYTIEPLQNTFVSGNVITKEMFTPQLFMEVLKQSKELQEVLVEQNKELQNKLLEKFREFFLRLLHN